MSIENLFKTWADKAREDFMQYVRKHIFDRIEDGTPITWEEYSSMTMNSYERRAMASLFDDECLVKIIKYALTQEGDDELSQYSLPKSYRDSILSLHIHELMRRFVDTTGDALVNEKTKLLHDFSKFILTEFNVRYKDDSRLLSRAGYLVESFSCTPEGRK